MLGKGELSVGLHVSTDFVAGSSGLLEGFSLDLDGVFVRSDGSSSHGEGVSSGSGSDALILVSIFLGLDGSVMGSDGFGVLLGSSGISSGGNFSLGVSVVEFLVGSSLFGSGGMEILLGSIVSGLGRALSILGRLPGFEGGRSGSVSSLELSDGDLVSGNGGESSLSGGLQLLLGLVVVSDGLLVLIDGSVPGGGPSDAESVGSGLLVFGGEVFVSSGVSFLDEGGVFLDVLFTSGLSFLEMRFVFEETIVSESSASMGGLLLNSGGGVLLLLLNSGHNLLGLGALLPSLTFSTSYHVFGGVRTPGVAISLSARVVFLTLVEEREFASGFASAVFAIGGSVVGPPSSGELPALTIMVLLDPSIALSRGFAIVPDGSNSPGLGLDSLNLGFHFSAAENFGGLDSGEEGGGKSGGFDEHGLFIDLKLIIKH